jgi:hypothetical protein
MHPSSCFAVRLPRSVKDPVPYSREALRQDLTRVRIAWAECQASRDRIAIYGYLSAVFDLVMWWAAEGRAISRARKALRLQRLDLPTTDEPFAAIILATADRKKVASERGPNGRACCGTQRSTNRLLNRLLSSSSGSVASMNVLRDLPVALGEAVETEVGRTYLKIADCCRSDINVG